MCGAVHPLHTPYNRMRRLRHGLLGVSSPSSGTRLLAKPPHRRGRLKPWPGHARGSGGSRGMSSSLASPSQPGDGWAGGGCIWRGAQGGCPAALQECSHHQPTFWQPCRGQVALLLPFPDPAFAGTWRYGQPACPGSWCQASALLPSDAPGFANPVPIPVPPVAPRPGAAHGSSRRGERSPPSSSFPHHGGALPAGGVPQDPAGPSQAGLGWAGAIPVERPRQGPPGPGARPCCGQR